MISLIRITVLVTALAMAGCVTVGPDYHKPSTPVLQLQDLDAARENAAR